MRLDGLAWLGWRGRWRRQLDNQSCQSPVLVGFASGKILSGAMVVEGPCPYPLPPTTGAGCRQVTSTIPFSPPNGWQLTLTFTIVAFKLQRSESSNSLKASDGPILHATVAELSRKVAHHCPLLPESCLEPFMLSIFLPVPCDIP